MDDRQFCMLILGFNSTAGPLINLSVDLKSTMPIRFKVLLETKFKSFSSNL